MKRERSGKNLEGRGDGIMEVLSRNLSRKAEENNETRVPAEIQTQYLPNKRLLHYRYTVLLGYS
jgi:hypothetical protein